MNHIFKLTNTLSYLIKMTNYTIDETQSPFTKLADSCVKINDTIEVVSNNQLGYKKFKVVLNSSGEKDLQIIADWGMELYED